MSYNRKDVLKAIMKSYDPLTDGDYEGFLAKELDTIDDIFQAIKTKGRDIRATELRHKVEMDAVHKNYRDIIDQCSHYSKTRHTDPSGGSDSFTECDICGKEL